MWLFSVVPRYRGLQVCYSGIFLNDFDVVPIIIIIIIIIGKDTISFMQGIYTYIPETNHVPKEYNVADILSLLFIFMFIIIIIIIIIKSLIQSFSGLD
jgi:hypothetical protein